MKVYISLPTDNKTSEELYNMQVKAIEESRPYLEHRLKPGEDIEYLDSIYTDIVRKNIFTLLECSLAELKKADVVIMTPRCESCGNSIIVHEMAVKWGIPIHYLN